MARSRGNLAAFGDGGMRVAAWLDSRTLPFELAELPPETVLVGGAVRDALLGRSRVGPLDLDFVLPIAAVETARTLAQRHGAGFVLLDRDRAIARVVFANGDTADFAQQMGADLAADLRRRDYTLNAIAYRPHDRQIIDPLDGLAAIAQGQLAMVHPDNLRDDPLRLLRAYRQCAQLGFAIAPDTQPWLQKLAPHLATVAGERVQAELNALLAAPDGDRWIRQAWQDGQFQHWLPDLTSQTLDHLEALGQVADVLGDRWPAFAEEFYGRDRVHRWGSWAIMARRALAVGPDPLAAQRTLETLKYSRAEIRSAIALLDSRRAIAPLHTGQPLTPRQHYDLFQIIRDTFPAAIGLWLAIGIDPDSLIPTLDRWHRPHDPIAHPVPLLGGKALMDQLDLPPGPTVGALLYAIAIAQAEDKIQTAAHALQFARAWLLETNQSP
jgi:tRNA nucleotidyltransferase (CCA-adding enzyme)